MDVHPGAKAESTLVVLTPSQSVAWGDCGPIIGDTPAPRPH